MLEEWYFHSLRELCTSPRGLLYGRECLQRLTRLTVLFSILYFFAPLDHEKATRGLTSHGV